MKRGEIYRTRHRLPERGNKAGFYVVVSREFVAAHERISTVVCAPVYSEITGLTSEVVIGPAEGMPRECSIRCDYLTLILKKQLTGFVATLPLEKISELNRALRLDLHE